MREANQVRTYDMPNEYAGRRLDHVIKLYDEDGDLENLVGYDGWGEIYDETGTVILTLDPTLGGAAGTFTLSDLIPSNTTPGRYFWRGGFGTSTGDTEAPVRLKGRIYIKA